MRRNIRERVETLAPFLTFDDDPYIIIGEDGRLLVDDGRLHDVRTATRTRGTTGSGRDRINYMRNSVKVVDRRLRRHDDASTSFDNADPIIAAYRGAVPEPVQGRVGDAARAAQARALSRSCCCSCRPPSTACTT